MGGQTEKDSAAAEGTAKKRKRTGNAVGRCRLGEGRLVELKSPLTYMTTFSIIDVFFVFY